jgi:deoxyribose-phosphate aldolase
MNIAKYIDHTLLKAEAGLLDVRKLCMEAAEYGFCSVCINGCHVKFASGLLANTPVKVCAVIGFPLGAMTTAMKKAEALDVISSGAHEIDMVINVGALKEKRYDYVYEDIKAVVDAAKGQAVVKVILENCLLERDEIINACRLCVKAGADFVKTSTGFSKGGAVVEDVILMKETVEGKAMVKAAGGIRDLETAELFIKAGADRLGCSASVEIVTGEAAKGTY